MNMNEMMLLAERGHEFIRYMKDFYSLDADGIYGEEYQFTEEEIVDGIGKYLDDPENYKNVMNYGADSIDREHCRNLILKMRGEA